MRWTIKGQMLICEADDHERPLAERLAELVNAAHRRNLEATCVAANSVCAVCVSASQATTPDDFEAFMQTIMPKESD